MRVEWQFHALQQSLRSTIGDHPTHSGFKEAMCQYPCERTDVLLLLMGPTATGANESTAVDSREIEQTTRDGRFMIADIKGS